MSITIIGPPCSVCGEPATSSINPDVWAAAGSGIYPQINRPFEPRCNEHNPYMSRCKRGHYQWGGNYCSTCGAPLHESLKVKQ